VESIDTQRVQELLDAGAQLVEVLPKGAYDREHLPGAVNLPLVEMTPAAAEALDRSRPVVTYCYDHECDLSSRAARWLEVLGFPEVYDYMNSKVAWLGYGLPFEGTDGPETRATDGAPVDHHLRAGVVDGRRRAALGPRLALGRRAARTGPAGGARRRWLTPNPPGSSSATSSPARSTRRRPWSPTPSPPARPGSGPP